MSIPAASASRNRLTIHVIDGDWTYAGGINANTTVTSGVVQASPVINCGAVGDIAKSPRYGYTLSGAGPVGNPAQMAANAAADLLAANAANRPCFIATNKAMTQAGVLTAIAQGYATQPSSADLFALVRDGTHSASAIAAKARLALFLTPFMAAIGSVRPTGLYSNDEEAPIGDFVSGNGATYQALYNSWLADATMQARIAALRARGAPDDQRALDALIRIAWNAELHWLFDVLTNTPLLSYYYGKAAQDCYPFKLDLGGAANAVGINELDGSCWAYQSPLSVVTQRLVYDLRSRGSVLTVPVIDVRGFAADPSELVNQWTALKNAGINDALLFVNQGEAGAGADLTAAASALASAQTVRLLPPYSGPMTDIMYPSAVTVLTATARNWTNAATLVGAPNGGFASATVPMGTVPDPSDKLKLAFTTPAGLTNASILGWQFQFRSISGVRSDAGVWEKGRCGVFVQPLDATNTRRGQPEGYHEYPGASASDFWQIQEYNSLDTSNFNQDSWTIFTGGGGAAGLKANTFADWPGMAFWLDQVSGANLGYSTTISIDAFGVVVAYTPPDPGTTIALTTATSPVMAGISAATAGIALDASFGNEVGWTSITSARVVDASRAQANGVDGELVNQTQFIPYYFGAGQIAAALGKNPCHIRLPIQCRFQDDSGLVVAGQIAYATVAEIALFSANGDGTINALICKSSDRQLYDQTNWKIGMHVSAATTSERIRVACLDITGISQANLTSMNTNGFAVLIRWRMSQPANDPGAPAPSHFIVNGVVSPTLSYTVLNTARPIARTTRSRRLVRCSRF